MAKAGSTSFKPHPDMRIVVLHGPDEWMRRHHFDALLAVLQKAHGEVEVRRLDGETAALADVLDELRSYTLMQTHKVVVVDAGEVFVKNHRQALERYADDPVDHATLVLRATTWHRGNFDKKLARCGAIVACEAPEGAAAQRWIVERCAAAHGRAIARDAAAALLQRVGPDLMKLDSELARLSLMAEGDAPIDAALVQREVGAGSDEQVWAVQGALLTAAATGRPAPAIAKVRELVRLAGHSEVAVGYFLAEAMRKVVLAQMMLARRVPQGQVVKQVRAWGDIRGPVLDLARRLPPARARALMHEAVEIDRRNKSGHGQPLRNIECFCAALADVRN